MIVLNKRRNWVGFDPKRHYARGQGKVAVYARKKRKLLDETWTKEPVFVPVTIEAGEGPYLSRVKGEPDYAEWVQ